MGTQTNTRTITLNIKTIEQLEKDISNLLSKFKQFSLTEKQQDILDDLESCYRNPKTNSELLYVFEELSEFYIQILLNTDMPYYDKDEDISLEEILNNKE